MTTKKKDLTEYGEAMGFDVPVTATATNEPITEGELMQDDEQIYADDFTDIPEHGSDALPIHQRSLPKVLLAVGAVSVMFGLPAYLFLSAASGGGGGSATTAKKEDKDKKTGLKDPQSDEINKLKTDLAVGKQLASASPSPSPSTLPTDDKTTTAKPSPSSTAPPSVSPPAPITPVVAKTNPPPVTPPPVNQKPVAPLPVVQPKPIAKAIPQPNPSPVVQPASVAANPPKQPTAPKVGEKPFLAAPSTVLVAKGNGKPINSPAPLAITSLAPKGIEYTPKNPPVTKTPAALVKSEPKPVTSVPLVTKTNPQPIEYTPKNPPIVPKSPVALVANPTPPLSWEQASAIGVYGDGSSSIISSPVGGLGAAAGVKDTGKQQPNNNNDGAMSPSLLLAAGTNVKGHTLAPFIASAASASNKQNPPVALSIGLDEAIELGQGFHLPVGTTVNFIASVNDNGSINAISKNANINGVEVQLPEGAITLSSEKNDLLMTKETTPGGGDLARADLNSSIWSGIAGAGRAILQSGSQTTTNTGLLGTTTTQTNNGSPNIIGGVLDGAFTPLATNGQRRAQQAADKIEQRSRVNTIDVGTKVKIFVNVPIKIQIPSGQVAGRTAVEDDESQPPLRLITSNSVPSPVNEEELPPPPLKAVAVQPPIVVSTPVQSSVVAPPPTSEVKLTPTVTPLSANPPKTRIAIP
jgi:hypothetical protein